jgi:hypothetical protein
MSKTPFYKKGIGKYQSQTPDGALLYHDGTAHGTRKVSSTPNEKEEIDVKAGLDPRFGWNEDGDRPISIMEGSGRGAYMPYEKTYTDAKAGTGMFDESLPANKPFSGYIRLGDKESTQISGDDLINMSYNDLKKLNVQGFKNPDGSYQNFAGTADEKSFKNFQRGAISHRKTRDQHSSIREKTLAYKAAGGRFKKPTVTKT